MHISLDSYISDKLGVDNHLCHPLRSISWWGLVTLDIMVLAMAWRNHASQRFDVVALTLINIAAMGTYFWLRTVVYPLTAGLTDEQTKKLRQIAAASLSIAGGVVAATLLFSLR